MERIRPSSITPDQARTYYRNVILTKSNLGLKDMHALFLANLIGTDTPIGREIFTHEAVEIVCLSRKTGESVEEIIKHPHQTPNPMEYPATTVIG